MYVSMRVRNQNLDHTTESEFEKEVNVGNYLLHQGFDATLSHGTF